MTLVITLTTPEAVVQVADRKLTDYRTGRCLNDNANKSVSYCGLATFGYTGLANIDGRSADMWLAETISGQPTIGHALEAVADRAMGAFRQIRLPNEMKRHSFVGTGWGRASPDEALSPYIWCVSNCLDERSDPVDYATEDFRLYVDVCDDVPFVVHSVGQPVPASLQKELRRNVEQCLAHGTSTVPLARLMISTIRKVADVNSAVGHGLLVSAIPRAAVESESPGIFLLASAPMEDQRTFLYIPEDNDTGVQRAPIYACHGGVMSNFVAKSLD